jgi:hypothetical protein
MARAGRPQPEHKDLTGEIIGNRPGGLPQHALNIRPREVGISDALTAERGLPHCQRP